MPWIAESFYNLATEIEKIDSDPDNVNNNSGPPIQRSYGGNSLHDLIRRNSQFIIVTHSPILMAYPDSTIYLFSDDAITPIDYTDTEHFNITRDFLNRREAMLRVLLGEDTRA